MESSTTQQLYFQHLKRKLPGHISFVDEIATFLEISNDSAYRRIRGDKLITFNEIEKLSTYYKTSLDAFLNLPTGSCIFNRVAKTNSEECFEDWLENIRSQFTSFNSYKEKHMYFLLKEIPPWANFLVPELTRFKIYFWMKSVFDYRNLMGVKFDIQDSLYNKFDGITKEIAGLYTKIPMTEIWNAGSIESLLRQINFYKGVGDFKNPKDVDLLYSKMEVLINHFEKQADSGLKFLVGQEPLTASPEYRMYLNELISGDDSVMVELDGTKTTFLNFGVRSTVRTADEYLNNEVSKNIKSVIKKSLLISNSGGNERTRFFNSLRQRIDEYRQTSLKQSFH